MSRRHLAVRLAFAALVIVAAAASLVSLAQEVIRTGRPASGGGPVLTVAALIVIVATSYLVHQVKVYLDETRPPKDAVACSSCGNHAAVFDRRCRRCGEWLKPRA
jgi:hypothetical protein